MASKIMKRLNSTSEIMHRLGRFAADATLLSVVVLVVYFVLRYNGFISHEDVQPYPY